MPLRDSLPALRAALALSASMLAACSADTSPMPDRCTGTACVDVAQPPRDATAMDTSTGCSPATCAMPGWACHRNMCVQDCRPTGAAACPSGEVCDYTDGRCRAPTEPGVLPAAFDACPSSTNPTRTCGPGTVCDGAGSCVVGFGCSGLDCDDAGRCWARTCATERPAAACSPAPLEQLNRAEFVGSLANGADREGAFDLDFDEVCTAYAVTMISGPDYLRQMTPDGTVTVWQSTTNLNMGEVAVLRVPGLEGTMDLGDVAATYICCATCGCIETGMDGRLGVIHLDRTSMTRPLPNVLAAMPTSGAGPFGSPSLDTGPYALTWAGDRALYAGNIEMNGDFMRVDLATVRRSMVAQFPARVVAAAPYDLRRLLVATQGGAVHLLETATGTFTPWATLPADPTSLHRDAFTGRVYAEVRTTPPQILELRADGTGMTVFQMPPRLGRIALAPDGYLYHLSVFPAVNWMAGNSIVRYQLPTRR